MKYFFIHKSKTTGVKVGKNTLGFIVDEGTLKSYINQRRDMKDYLKIPSFKSGDKVKIISAEETELTFLKDKYSGKEFTIRSMDRYGKLNFEEYVPDTLYIVDIQTL